MRLILAVTRSRADVGLDVEARARAAFAVCHGRPPALHLTDRDHARSGPVARDEVFASEAEPGDLIDDRAEVFATLLLRSSYTTGGEVLDGRRLLDRVRRDTAATLCSIAPPFGACFRDRPGGPIVVTTDSCGLRHLYVWQGEGWAAASSSSVVLAWVVGAPIDERAMGTFAHVGNHLLQSTPFQGITKLDAGSLCRLQGGALSIERFDLQRADAPVASGGRSAQAARGVNVLRDAVGACLDAYPDAGLELSGGFDSRAVLAAIPRAERRGRYALTLGTPGNADIRVATGIAESEGLRHQVIDLEQLEHLTPEEVLDLARGAARRRDCSANPMGTGVLDWIESQIDQVPRFNGQNSEFGRAHLYPGQRQQGAITDERIDRLARWRILQNHNTDPVVLTESFAAVGHEAALGALREQFDRFGVDWLRSLDEYYFLSRMQRWAGIDYTAAGYDRVVLAPFFHPDYLAWVRASDPADRRASRVFAKMFDLLDPDLARRPLHLGISPHEIAAGGPAIAVKRAAIGGAQTSAKVWQRVRKVGRGSSGADRFAELVVAAWRGGDDPMSRLERYGFLDLDNIQQVIDGAITVSSATVAFLVDLEVLTDLDAELHRHLDAPAALAG